MQTQSLDLLADQLVFVNLDITCWSGRKTLTPEDLGLDRAQRPPESLVSLGDKQLINPEALRAFTSLRSAARRHCLAVGTRFLGGYAVPAAQAQGLLDRLSDLQRQYAAARATFLADYDSQLAAWAAAQPPEWRKLIRDARVPAEHVGGRLRFAVQAARFAAPAPDVVDHPGLADALSGLAGQVAHEVACLARDTLEQSFQGKTEVTRRALGPFQAIHDKLDGLSFVDSRFRAVVGEIDRLLASIPPRLPIRGRVLEGLRQFLCLASQPDGLRTFAENAASEVECPAGLFEAVTVTDARLAFAVDAGAEVDAETGAGPSPLAADAGAEVDVEAGPSPFAVDAGADAGPSPFTVDAGAETAAETATEPEPAVSTEDAGWFF